MLKQEFTSSANQVGRTVVPGLSVALSKISVVASPHEYRLGGLVLLRPSLVPQYRPTLPYCSSRSLQRLHSSYAVLVFCCQRALNARLIVALPSLRPTQSSALAITQLLIPWLGRHCLRSFHGRADCAHAFTRCRAAGGDAGGVAAGPQYVTHLHSDATQSHDSVDTGHLFLWPATLVAVCSLTKDESALQVTTKRAMELKSKLIALFSCRQLSRSSLSKLCIIVGQ